MKASVQYAGDELFVAISPGGHAQVLETNGQRGRAASPMELLLMALGGCTGVDVVSILQKKREKLTGYQVVVRGERREEYPRSFERIEVHHVVRGYGLSEKAVADAVALSDQKYCSVAATLRPAAEIVSTIEIVEETAPALP